jgi:ribosome-associated translation inhibitor RaiA
MSTDVRITFRHMDHSAALESRVQKLIRKLERRSAALQSCNVVVDAPARPGGNAGHYAVRLELKIPGGEIVVNQDDHDDAFVVLQRAFTVAGRQLAGYEERRREARAVRPPDAPAGARDE